MTQKTKKINPMKKEIGRRFKLFRETLKKTQTQLAEELNVYQSTVTNIELGKTFPGIKYLEYFHVKYRLNTNWLLNETGQIFVAREEDTSPPPSLLRCHIKKDDIRYDRYKELMELMKVPVVEQLILAKLVELKVLAKEEIEIHQKREKEISLTPDSH